MTPQERTARIAGLFMELLNTLPSTSQTMYLSREDIAAREQQGRELRAEISELAEQTP